MNRQTCDICAFYRVPYVPIHLQDNGQAQNPNTLHTANMCASCLITRFEVGQPCPICRVRFMRPPDSAIDNNEEDAPFEAMDTDVFIANSNAEQIAEAQQRAAQQLRNNQPNNVVQVAQEVVQNSPLNQQRQPNRRNPIQPENSDSEDDGYYRRQRRRRRVAPRSQPEPVLIPATHCYYREEKVSNELPHKICFATENLQFSQCPGTPSNLYCNAHITLGPYKMRLLERKEENRKLEKENNELKRLGEQLLKEENKKTGLELQKRATTGYFNHLGEGTASIESTRQHILNPQAPQQQPPQQVPPA